MQVRHATVVVADDHGIIAIPLLRAQLDRVELHGRGSCSTVGGGGGSEALPPPAPRRTTDVDATMTLEVVFYNRRTAEWDTVLQPWSVVGAVRPPPSPPLRRGRVRAHAS